MPSFESIRPSKKARTNSDSVVSDHHNDINDDDRREEGREGEKDGKRAFLKRTWKHCKRPGSALVAKHVGQPILAKSSIVPISVSVLNPTPTTIDFSMYMTLTLPISLPVQTEPMIVDLRRDGHSSEGPFLKVTLPACEIQRSADIRVCRHTTDVLDMVQFGDFINDVMFNKSVMLKISGSAKAQSYGFKSRLQINDYVEVAGFDNFPGFVIKSCQLLLPRTADGALLEAVLDLPNPSLATIELGDMRLNLHAGPIMVGQVLVSNATLSPGPNIVSSRVSLDTQTAMTNLGTIIHSQKDLLRQGLLGLKVTGESAATRNGENIVYYENALPKLQLYSQVPISRVLGNIVGGIATSVAPSTVLTFLSTTGILGVLQGNGVDLAQLEQLEHPV